MTEDFNKENGLYSFILEMQESYPDSLLFASLDSCHLAINHAKQIAPNFNITPVELQGYIEGINLLIEAHNEEEWHELDFTHPDFETCEECLDTIEDGLTYGFKFKVENHSIYCQDGY